jgi:hypothetical protein
VEVQGTYAALSDLTQEAGPIRDFDYIDATRLEKLHQSHAQIGVVFGHQDFHRAVSRLTYRRAPFVT